MSIMNMLQLLKCSEITHKTGKLELISYNSHHQMRFIFIAAAHREVNIVQLLTEQTAVKVHKETCEDNLIYTANSKTTEVETATGDGTVILYNII